MYRLLIFIVLLGNSSSKVWKRQEKTHHEDYHLSHYSENNFYKLVQHIISMERKFENTCRDNMYKRVREVYSTDYYALKYSIPEFEAKDIVIKVKYRAIYISAQNFVSVGSNSFWDLKILPDNLETEHASWILRGGELEISFPYRVPLGEEIKKSCGYINYSVIDVPMKVPPPEEKQPTDDKINPDDSPNDGGLIKTN